MLSNKGIWCCDKSNTITAGVCSKTCCRTMWDWQIWQWDAHSTDWSSTNACMSAHWHQQNRKVPTLIGGQYKVSRNFGLVACACCCLTPNWESGSTATRIFNIFYCFIIILNCCLWIDLTTTMNTPLSDLRWWQTRFLKAPNHGILTGVADVKDLEERKTCLC